MTNRITCISLRPEELDTFIALEPDHTLAQIFQEITESFFTSIYYLSRTRLDRCRINLGRPGGLQLITFALSVTIQTPKLIPAFSSSKNFIPHASLHVVE